MGIEGVDGLLLLFMAIASRDWAVLVRFSNFLPPSKMSMSPVLLDAAEFSAACLYMYLGSIWRLWMGIEGMDGLLLLFTAIASHKYLGDRDIY